MMLGQPATGEDFCGRRQELDDLWRYLENEHIRFPGVRRLGKTSILKRLQEQAAEQGVLARWLDVSHIHSAESFVLALEQAYPIPLHTSCYNSSRAKRIPSTHTAMSRSPSHNVLAPGSPSPFRPRKPPSCAISLTTAFSDGVSFGGRFLFKIYAARHSSASNSRSAGKSGKLRPSRINLLILQLTTR